MEFGPLPNKSPSGPPPLALMKAPLATSSSSSSSSSSENYPGHILKKMSSATAPRPGQYESSFYNSLKWQAQIVEVARSNPYAWQVKWSEKTFHWSAVTTSLKWRNHLSEVGSEDGKWENRGALDFCQYSEVNKSLQCSDSTTSAKWNYHLREVKQNM